MIISETRLIFKENLVIILKFSRLFVNNFSMTFESIDSKEIGRKVKALVFRLFLKIVLTFADLKALGNLFKDIERVQISVTGLARTLAPSFRNLPGNLPMTSAFEVSISLKLF